MPDTAAQRAPLSRTEIAMRVKGIIADVLACGCHQAHDEMLVKYVGVAHGARRSNTAIAVIVDRVEKAFGVRLEDAHAAPNTFALTATVGELIALVEGALSQGGIA
jgi:hypothetical protein